MKIESIKSYRYALPLTEPMALRGQKLEQREGLLVQLTDQQGNSGWGEIAPLPCFSQESVGDATDQLQEIIQKISGIEFDSVGIDQPDSYAILPEVKLYPSVRFGLEMALLALADSGGQVVSSISIPLNGLILSLSQITPKELTRLTRTGFRSFKVKVGRTELAEEIKQLETLVSFLPENCQLRLDANRTWSYDQALEFCYKTVGLPIEYLEEPLADPSELAKLAQAQTTPIALDESLLEPDGRSLIGRPGIGALVLKPTLLGGIGRTLELVRLGQSHQMTAVISSSFESEIGINYLAGLAYTVAPETAHGLDTLGAFGERLTDNRLEIIDGRLSPRTQTDLTIDLSKVTEVFGD